MDAHRNLHGILEEIKKVRKAKGYSQKKMAEELELSQVAYNNIERGQTQLSIERLSQISQLLGLSFFNLLRMNYQDENYKELKHDLDAFKGRMDHLKNIVQYLSQEAIDLFDFFWASRHELSDTKKTGFYNSLDTITKMLALVREELEYDSLLGSHGYLKEIEETKSKIMKGEDLFNPQSHRPK